MLQKWRALAPAQGGSCADEVLERQLHDLCPEDILEAEAEDTLEWTLDLNSDCQGEWLLADLQKPASKEESPDRRAMDRRSAAAAGIELELRWYFQERDSRVLGWRRDPVGCPCARTVFARRLRRFAATSLRSSDRSLLDAWCTYLRRVADARPFSSSNRLWKSQFERSLVACLVRLEALCRWMDGQEAEPRPPKCSSRREDVQEAVARRGRATHPRVPLKHFALYRQITRVQVPGLWGLIRLQSLTAGLALSAAHLALVEQLLSVARDYSAGELDQGTLAEDALVSVSSAGIFVIACSASPAVVLGSSWLALPLEALGPSFLAWLTGALVRTSGRRLCGGPAMRSLRCAYLSLGLNPAGVSSYTAQDVEAQLEWAVRQRRADVAKLWAAYEYIRQHQHSGLRDPWQP